MINDINIELHKAIHQQLIELGVDRMKLNKEKHLESYCDIMKGFYIREDVLNYGKLIEEYFDNPPLKFEELHEGMWLWDNKLERYIKVYDISYAEQSFNVNGEWYLNDLYLEEFDFEENRFYRKQVEE